MIYALIGHRGVGKSALLKRLQGYGANTIDLDEEIAKQEKQSVAELFTSRGEKQFRKLEVQVLQKIQSQHNTSSLYVSVGAGFEGPWPVGVKKIWVRRASDENGRIFLNRPRLNSDLKPLEEFFLRKAERDKRFYAWADRHYFMPEGLPVDPLAERLFFGYDDESEVIGGTLTIKPRHLQDLKLWMRQGLEFFEVRDDLLNETQAKEIFDSIPRSRILASIRTPNSYLIKHQDRVEILDWAMELGPCPDELSPTIISLHKREENLEETLQKLESVQAPYVKLAIPIESLEELKVAHNWWMGDREFRMFFPNSSGGRWSWYRTTWGRAMRLNFIRDDEGTSPDQPTFYEWFQSKVWQKSFAAILGDPVDHSWTPSEHREFFKKYGMPVVKVRISEKELTEENLKFLCELGLTAAAVTAPLKNMMFNLMDEVTLAAEVVKSVNTFLFDGQKFLGHNTDFAGLEEAVKDFKENDSIAVWGGGGTLEILKQVLPQAQFFSAREGTSMDTSSPDILVWAVGRSRADNISWPPQNWRHDFVFDLNYTDDSPGLEWAEKHADFYRSGDHFFREQALRQREWWKDNFGEGYVWATI